MQEKYSSFIDRISENERKQIVKKHSPGSPIIKNTILAFLVGGLICGLGEAIREGLVFFGLEDAMAKTLTSLSLILLGGVATSLGFFDRIASHAGAGAMLPITGFSNSVVSEAMDSRSEGEVLGVGAKMFTIAGPVILFGTISGVIYGVFYYISSFMGK